MTCPPMLNMHSTGALDGRAVFCFLQSSERKGGLHDFPSPMLDFYTGIGLGKSCKPPFLSVLFIFIRPMLLLLLLLLLWLFFFFLFFFFSFFFFFFFFSLFLLLYLLLFLFFLLFSFCHLFCYCFDGR